MVQYAHKGQILPLANQMIPIDKQTTFHAPYDYHLNGMNQGDLVYPLGTERALNFDGTNAFIDCGNSTIFNAPSITLEVWVNLTRLPVSTYATIISKEAQWKYRINSSGYIEALVASAGGGWTFNASWTGTAITLGQWTHIALVINSTANTIEAFMNGISLSSKALGGGITAYSTKNVNIGSYNNSGNEQWIGMMSEARIWNKALSISEVQKYMYDRNPPIENLLGYWKLNEKEGKVSYDASEKGNDGVWKNNVTPANGTIIASLLKGQGKFGGAVAVGVDGSIGKLWYPKELINPASFSISLWVNIPHVHSISTNNIGIQGNWFHTIIECAPTVNNGNSCLSIAINPSDGWGDTTSQRRVSFLGPVASGNSQTAIQDNTWYHITATYDGTNYKLYINGNLEVTVAGSPFSPTSNYVLMVGGGYRGRAYSYIDELRIESRAILADEAAAWAASGLHYNYLDYSMYVD